MHGLARLFEPEETVGALWHRLIGDGETEPAFPDAGAALSDAQGALGVFFRGAGGPGGVTIKGVGKQPSRRRLSVRETIAGARGSTWRARFDGDTLFLPERLDSFPDPALNRGLYVWLAAFAACADPAASAPADPLARDAWRFKRAFATTARALTRFPGLRGLYRRLATAALVARPRCRLPPAEADVEAAVRVFLAGDDPTHDALAVAMRAQKAPRGYRAFRPVPLWVDIEARAPAGRSRSAEDDASGAGDADEGDAPTKKARRNASDQIARDDSLILHRFESILSWTDMIDINRSIEDDDEDSARKAADDHDEIGLAHVARRPATALRFDLDLSPEDAERERLAAKIVYPEWDYRAAAYRPAYCRVLAGAADEAAKGEGWRPDAATRRRIRAVKRQFEALRPKRERLRAQKDGADVDLDALVRARVDAAASGACDERVFEDVRKNARDLAVAVLIDVSRSTEAVADGKPVIDTAREALAALAGGLSATGDAYAVYAFSSCTRRRVFVSTVKRFDEPLSARVLARVAALRPSHYTRLGAAMRHATAALSEQPHNHRLLLIISDGKPNDLDHYEGRYGVEDCRMAAREARRAGQAVFAVTIDAKAREHFARMFGPAGFAVVSRPSKLSTALPQIYRHLVG